MPVIIRPARSEELHRAEELVVRSINDLSERHGFGFMASLRAPHFQLFCLRDDPDGLWVAEADDEIAGFALSWVCGNLWFLAELFIAPGLQGTGIGNQLLAYVFAHADKSATTNKSLITFAFNVTSQGLYVKHGMLPRLPLYMVGGARDRLTATLDGDRLRMVPAELNESHLALLVRLDAEVLGVSREKHHRYLAGDPSVRGFLLYDEVECVGYAYVSSAGHIGPIAVAQSQFMGAAFRSAMDVVTASAATRVSALLPGSSEALRVAIAHGLRITFPMVLVAQHDFGDWTRYLPRSPGFM